MGGPNPMHALLAAVTTLFVFLSTEAQPTIDLRHETYITKPENTPIGTVLTNITALKTTPGGSVTVTTNSDPTANIVSLHQFSSTVWNVKLKATLDYETTSQTVLSFLATPSDGQTLPFTFVLYISDVNDNNPQFRDLPYNANVSEDAVPGSIVFTKIKTYDPDTGVGGVVDYSMRFVSQGGTGVSDVFFMDGGTGIVNLTGALDYETTSIYHYEIIASDRGIPSLSSSTDLYITVTDVQDSPPYFTNLPYIVNIDENARMLTPVLTVKALDRDRAVPNDVVYNITDVSVYCPRMFDLNYTTGGIFVASSLLDRDSSPLKNSNGLCSLTVQATELDQHPPQRGNYTAMQKVTITVEDVNDNRPTFSGTRFSARILENSAKGTQLGLDNGEQIYVQDRDQGTNSAINLTLFDPTSTFELVSTSLRSSGILSIRVKNHTNLDFEARKQINFTITAEDSGGAGNINSTAHVTVQILNLNEFSPRFTQSSYSKNVQEGTPKDSSVIQITAHDSDDEDFGNIEYSLRNDRGMFQINSTDGTVTLLSNQTDRETFDAYYMSVLATDRGGLIQTAPLIIAITDANDNAPQFSRNQYDALLDEDSLTFSRPLTLQATDLDQQGTPNSNVSFAILSSVPPNLSSNFRLDPITGQLTVVTPLDYDTLPFAAGQERKVIMTVTARDQGIPILTSTAVVEIILNDLNDNPSVSPNTPCPGSIKEAAADVVTTAQPTRHHDVTCLDNRISFSIPFPGNLPRAATLSDPRCHVDTAGGNLMGSINLNSCGTTVAFTNDSVIFRNVITVASADNSTGDEGLIPIQCKYDRFATVQLSYMPVVRHVLFTEVGIGQLSFRIQQFRDASYLTAVADSQYPLRMEPNERVYIQLSLGDVLSAGHKDDIGINVQECVASPFSTLLQAQSNSVPLIQESCPASNDVQLMTIYPEDIQRVRFSFKVVSFPDLQNQLGDFGLVFVHCRVSVCPAHECSASNRTCPDPSAIRRVRRSAHDSVSTHQLSTGPFLVSEDKGGAVSSTTALAAVSMVVAAIATVVAMVAVVAWRRSRREAIGQKC